MTEHGSEAGLARQMLVFARANRAYWLIPLLAMLGLTGLLVLMSGGGAPLVYSLF